MTVGLVGIHSSSEHVVSQILKGSIGVVMYDENAHTAHELAVKLASTSSPSGGICVASYTLDEFFRQIPPPRIILLQGSDRKHMDGTIAKLFTYGLSQGDILIDAGKSETPDTIRRYQELRVKGCGFIDCGILLDAPKGRFSLMLGGDESAVKQLSWLWDALAGVGSWKYAGRSGNGHYTAYH